MDRELVAPELKDRLHDGSSLDIRLTDAKAMIGAQVTTVDLGDPALAHDPAGALLGLVAQHLEPARVHDDSPYAR